MAAQLIINLTSLTAGYEFKTYPKLVLVPVHKSYIVGRVDPTCESGEYLAAVVGYAGLSGLGLPMERGQFRVWANDANSQSGGCIDLIKCI